jgi:hypothetical protein
LRSFASEHETDGMLSVLFLVTKPVTQNGVTLPAAPCASESNIICRTRDENGLPRQRLPNYLLGRSVSPRFLPRKCP